MTAWPDLVNGAYELLAGVAVLGHCRKLWHDKEVKGASAWATAFFFSWGLWNLWYYPHLDQWASFLGGIGIALANCIWLTLMTYYIKHPDPRPDPREREIFFFLERILRSLQGRMDREMTNMLLYGTPHEPADAVIEQPGTLTLDIMRDKFRALGPLPRDPFAPRLYMEPRGWPEFSTHVEASDSDGATGAPESKA